MNSLKELYSRRKLQLETQKDIDAELKNSINKCPKLVAGYLLHQRHLARIQQNEIINSSFWNLKSVMETHLNENDELYKQFYNFDLKNKTLCENLANILYKK